MTKRHGKTARVLLSLPAKKACQHAAKAVTQVEKVRVGTRQGWRVTCDVHHKTVVTSPSSAAAIKVAAKKFNSVLKRLADK